MQVSGIPTSPVGGYPGPKHPVPTWEPDPNQPLIPDGDFPAPTLPGEQDDRVWDPFNPPLYG